MGGDSGPSKAWASHACSSAMRAYPGELVKYGLASNLHRLAERFLEELIDIEHPGIGVSKPKHIDQPQGRALWRWLSRGCGWGSA